MKAFFLTMIVCAGLVFHAISQEKSTLAVGPSPSEITAGKSSGKFTFIMPEGTVAEDLAHSTKYYTNYFTVDFNASTREAKITMVNNDEKSRSIIARFLISNGVQELNIGGVLVPVTELFERYLK
jgi:hypothetical protein